MTDRYQDAPRLALDCENARLMTLVVEAAGALSAPRAPCAIVGIEPPERSPAGPWLGLLAAGPDLFGMSEPDGHALLAEMAAGLVAACPGVRALAPVAGVADITVTLATEAGRLVTFAPAPRHRPRSARLARDRRAPRCGAPRACARLPVE